MIPPFMTNRFFRKTDLVPDNKMRTKHLMAVFEKNILYKLPGELPVKKNSTRQAKEGKL